MPPLLGVTLVLLALLVLRQILKCVLHVRKARILTRMEPLLALDVLLARIKTKLAQLVAPNAHLEL
jgi:hypothetical protein